MEGTFPKNFQDSWENSIKNAVFWPFLAIFDHFYKVPKTGLSALRFIVTKIYNDGFVGSQQDCMSRNFFVTISLPFRYHFSKCSETWNYHSWVISVYANVGWYQKIRNFLVPKQGNEKGSEDKISKKPVGNNRFFLVCVSLHYGKNPFLKIFLGKLFSGIEFWTF